MQLRGDAFTDAQKARNFAYYEQITVRDSSLSACTQAIMAAEVGYVELAYDYLGEAALMDLHDLEHNTRDGLHMASLAGSWLALVTGPGGMRRRHGTLSFAPRLPERITRLASPSARPAQPRRDTRRAVSRRVLRWTSPRLPDEPGRHQADDGVGAEREPGAVLACNGEVSWSLAWPASRARRPRPAGGRERAEHGRRSRSRAPEGAALGNHHESEFGNTRVW